MRYVQLPGLAREASAIALGTAWFGTNIPADDAFRLLDAFAAAGGNFLDTAHMYASWVPGGAGKSEQTVGQWLRRAGAPPMLVGTKGADRGMTRTGIRAQLAESLDRLGLPRVDLYWLHRDDPKVPAGEIIEWLNELVGEGRFSAFGCSNWVTARIAAAQDYAAAKKLRGFAASQIGWSLARVSPTAQRGAGQVYVDDEIVAFHRRTGLAQVAYSSQAGGFFAGSYDPTGPRPGCPPPNANVARFYGTPQNYARQALVHRLAAARGCTSNQLALAALLDQPFPLCAIVGANSVARVADACTAADLRLTAAEAATLGIA